MYENDELRKADENAGFVAVATFAGACTGGILGLTIAKQIIVMSNVQDEVTARLLLVICCIVGAILMGVSASVIYFNMNLMKKET